MVRLDSSFCAATIFLTHYTAVILLDELEKAHKASFLTVFGLVLNAKRDLYRMSL